MTEIQIDPIPDHDKPSLIVVDDEPYILDIMREFLESEQGYRINFFSRSPEALEFIRTHQVDLVLTDYIMDDCTGREVLENTLRSHSDAVVIIMTGHPTVENAISVLKLGAYDYLIKPFKLETLKATIERGLKTQQLTRENGQLKNLVTLYRISEAMGSTIRLGSLLNLVLESIVKEFEVDLVSICLWDPQSEALKLEAFHGSDREIMNNPFLSGKADTNYKALLEKRPQVLNTLEGGEGAKEGAGPTTYVSTVCHPLLARGKGVGTLNLLRRSSLKPFGVGELHSLSIIASKATTAIENSRLYIELEQAYFGTVMAFANAVEARDHYTRGHTDRVCTIAERIAKELGWSEEQLKHLYIGCVLHDIGKIGVPDSILNKPGRLSPEETEIMRRHPETGVKMLEGITFLEPALPYVLYHHEHYDGSGYPLGLKGANIPLEGRLLAIADTVDAILTNRPYRPAATFEKVVSELEKHSGSQFDPLLITVFLKILERDPELLERTYGRHARAVSNQAIGQEKVPGAAVSQ